MPNDIPTGGWPDDARPENWRSILGYEGLYEVSDLGRIRTLGGGKARTHGRILKATLGTTGYLRVALSAGNVSRSRKVHQLVAEAFIGPRPCKAYVLHNDGNPLNNTPGNLRYGDARSNLEDAILHGVWQPARGEAAGTAKLTAQGVIEIRASAETHAALARRYGVAPKTIRDIRNNRSWSHV